MATRQKLGWLVIEETSRDGCDISPSIQQFRLKRDAEAEADLLRAERPDDECYTVTVRKETHEDAERYGRYAWAG